MICVTMSVQLETYECINFELTVFLGTDWKCVGFARNYLYGTQVQHHVHKMQPCTNWIMSTSSYCFSLKCSKSLCHALIAFLKKWA